MFKLTPFPWIRSLTTLLIVGTVSIAPSTQKAHAYQSDSQVAGLVVNDTSMIAVRLDGTRLKLPATLQDESKPSRLRDALKNSPVYTPMMEVLEILRGDQCQFIVDLPYSPNVRARVAASKSIPEQKLYDVANAIWPYEKGKLQSLGDNLFIELSSQRQELPLSTTNHTISPLEKETWFKANLATEKFPLQVLVVLPSYLRETFRELDPSLPENLGGGSTKPFVQDLQWVSIGLNPDTLTFRAILHTNSNDSAKKLRDLIPKLVAKAVRQSGLDDASSALIAGSLGLLNFQVVENDVVFGIEDVEMTSDLLAMAESFAKLTTAPFEASNTSNRMKQLLLGIHNYESAFQCIPMYNEFKTRQKKSQLSWRVHILPFIGEQQLYSEFKLDEAWDSPHNMKLLEKMPKIFAPAVLLANKDSVKPFHTTLVAPMGEKTLFGKDKYIQLRSVQDGTSNSIAIVEVEPAHAVPWTSTVDYPYSVENPAAKLRFSAGHTMVGLLDGSVVRLEQSTTKEKWNALFTINGGEVVQP